MRTIIDGYKYFYPVVKLPNKQKSPLYKGLHRLWCRRRESSHSLKWVRFIEKVGIFYKNLGYFP